MAKTRDETKTKTQLVDELQALRKQIAELQSPGASYPARETILESGAADRSTWFYNSRDIINGQRAEEGVQKSEKYLRILLNSIPSGIVVIDAETHVIVDVNSVALEMIGASREQVIGSVCHNYICPAERCPVTDLGQTVDHSERVLLTADGANVPIIKSVTAIMLDGRQHLIESFVDITDRQRIEKALRESEEKHRAILTNIEEGYYEVDLAGNLTFFNDALCNILGYPADELMGMNNRQYMDAENAKKVFQTFNMVYETGEPTRAFDWEIIGKDGSSRLVEASVSLMRDATDNPIGFRGIARDVTEQRYTQAEREEILGILEHRSTQLQTAAEVSRAVSSILDPEALTPQVVDLVRERFGLYYAGLFLVDQTGEWTGEPYKWAVLRAGTGEAGQQMLKRGHKLEIGGSSMIGWCIANKQARIALDVGEDAVRFDNPSLPETRSELALPLINRGRPIGALTIQSDREAAFSKDDVTVLQTMADQLANAIANARLYNQAHREINERKRAEEETQRRAAQAGLIYEVGRNVSGKLEQEALLSEVVTAVRDAFDYYGVSLLLLDEESERLTLQSVAGEHTDTFPEDFSLQVGEGIIGQAAATGESQISGDVGKTPNYIRRGNEKTRSELAVPIKSGQAVIGVLDLQSDRFNAFDETDALVIQTLADQVAIAIENARLYQAMEQELGERTRIEEALRSAHEELARYTDNLERRTAQLQVGAEVAREAAAILDVQQLLDTAVRLISERFGFYHAGVFLIDEGRGGEGRSGKGKYAVMRAASSEGGRRMLERGHKLQVGKVGIVGYVAATGDPRIAGDVGQDAVHFAHGDLPDTRSEMGLPLTVRGKTIGVLDVQSTLEAAFSEDDVAVLQTLADQLAVAIDNARLVQRTETQLRELSLLYGEYTARIQDELASGEGSLGYVYDRIDVMPADSLSAPILDKALAEGETVALVEPDTAERMLATPLKLHDQIIGTLGIQETDGGQGWSPSEIALVEAVSEQVALALENAQHFAETQRAATQMQVLNELGQALAASLSVNEVLEESYQGASRLLDTSNFYIALYDEEKNQVSVPLNITQSATDSQVVVMPADQGITGYIVQNRTSVLIEENIRGWQKEKGIEPVGDPARSWLGVPILIGERVLGVMAAQSFTTTHVYDERDRDLLTAIASQTAIALQNAYLFEETQRRVQELGTLFDASQHLSSALLQAEEIAEIVVRQFVEVMNVPEASLSLVDEEGMMHVLADFYTENGDSLTMDGADSFRLANYPTTTRVMETLQPLVIHASDIDADPAEMAYMEEHGALTLVIIPLAAKGQAIGVIELEIFDEERHFTQDQLNLAVTLANQSAVALDNAHLFEETQRRATQFAAAAEVARDATSILDVDQLLDETVHLISDQFKFYHAGVFLLDEGHGGAEEYAVLCAASSEGGRRMLERGHKLPVGRVGIVGNVAATGQPRIALDVGEDAWHFVNPDLPNTRSEMGLPLKVRERVIGVLDVQSTQVAAFSDEDVAVLQTLADQLAGAIVNARLFQEVRTEATRRALINEVQEAAAKSLDPDELLHRAGEVISRRLERASALFSWDPRERSLRPIAVHDRQGEDVILSEETRITRKVNPLLFSDIVDERHTSAVDLRISRYDQSTTTLAEQIGIQTGIFVPLTVRDQLLGVLAVAQPDGHAPEGMDFVEIIGANLSVALENARLYQEAVETAEQLQEMDRLKSQFLANMSHELRTPLNSIIGFSRVILKGIDGPLTDMQRTDLEAVYSSGQHLLGLINDILDISKIQAGKMEITIEDTDVNDIVKGVMSTAIALVKDKHIELQQAVPPDVPIIQADARRIRQVLLNIVGNATKFTDEGFIRVEVETTPTEVIIAVIDSGVGIPEVKIGNIFEEFTQVDGSSTRAVGGTGLGLAISRRFVEMHGGRIWVESTVNVGSTFYLALPIAGPPEPSEEPEEEKMEETAASRPKSQERTDARVVLCVDDDEGVITLFRRYLSKQGYDVVGLTEGIKVMEKAQELRPFAITLDVMMPEKDGWQIIQELKSNPDTRHIPVIMCSIVADQDRGISLGASGYLVKPILEDDLVAALEQLDHVEEHHRVLIVDDHAEDRNLLRRMIESQEGYEVLEATGGQEAIDLISSVRPNIIVLDLMMPDVDGFTVLESIKADTETRHIPIIVVTAKDLSQQERKALNKRVQALLQKGIFEQQELLADVAAALKRIEQ